ncbi:trigger factor [Faecalicoccus acidiformans]|uniref:Trigger factor n=1 Tax=Faecalicoccus acidiformans TaxID=915173 RepID=A0A7W8D3R4_9FIRM|nr:trigger factor [Faecalicoccus acidiformans]MBB5185419.1 trigger factor [Faecalicoccus acidiformans]MBM6830647.1 trigger factor [Faecalicoccus acidiformans]HIW18482.1 trigger factor [Candidatus Faecalicoccus intestinipullorum]
METKWTLNEHSTGELEVVVDKESWQKAQKKVLNNLKKQMNLKGFRQGHVPEALIRKQISKAGLHEFAAEEVANEALAKGIEETKIELVARPTMELKEADDEKAVLVFHCTVIPEVTLKEYKGLDIHKEEVNVTDEDVEEEVKRIQNRYADWVLREEEEAAQNGDQVVIDYAGTIDGVPFEGGSAENYPLELGSNTFIPGFEDQLVGVKTGDEKDVVVTFPEDYNAADLAGKEAVFKCTVHDIKYKELPEANDELIQKLKREGVETLEKFKETTKEDLTKRREEQAERAFEEALIAKVSEDAEVEIPEVMIENEINRLFRNFENQMSQSGFTAKQYYEATGQTEADLKNMLKPDAQHNVKTMLVLEAVVKQEGIEVTEEDINKEYENMSKTYGMDVDRIKQIVSADNIRYDLAQQKAVDLIKASVK